MFQECELCKAASVVPRERILLVFHFASAEQTSIGFLSQETTGLDLTLVAFERLRFICSSQNCVFYCSQHGGFE